MLRISLGRGDVLDICLIYIAAPKKRYDNVITRRCLISSVLYVAMRHERGFDKIGLFRHSAKG
jgi:hypothetical protein